VVTKTARKWTNRFMSITTQIVPKKKHHAFFQQHPSLVHLLGLGPLLAITSSAASGIVYGLASLFVLVCSAVIAGFIRLEKDSAVRLPVAMQQYAFAFTRSLGIFLPLLASQSLIYLLSLELAETDRVYKRAKNALFIGAAYLAALIGMGVARELLSHGTVFSEFNLLFNALDSSAIKLLGETWRFKLVELAPGAFIILGLAVALTNIIKAKQQSNL
jgi:electron transport complex protein RnfE